jgi:hypothetical protein
MKISEIFGKSALSSKVRKIPDEKLGHFQEIFFFFFLNHVCSLLWDNYSRMQLFGYGVKKKPFPNPPPKT